MATSDTEEEATGSGEMTHVRAMMDMFCDLLTWFLQLLD